LKNAKHQLAVNRRIIHEQSTAQSLLVQNINKKSDFNSNFAQFLLTENTPFYKVNRLKFKDFLEKCTTKNIPDESTLRKNYIDDIHEKILTKIQTELLIKFGYQWTRLRMSMFDM